MSPSPADLVNPRQGTDSDFGFSRGNTYPATALPFGMTAWSPQTNASDFFYRWRDASWRGLRATHQPSPWMGDYGSLLLMPLAGDLVTDAEARVSAFRHDEETSLPYRYAVTLRRYGIRLEVAPSERCALLRLVYPAGADPWLVLEPAPGPARVHLDPDARRARLWTGANRGGAAAGFGCWYLLEFDAPVAEVGTFRGGARGGARAPGRRSDAIEGTEGTGGTGGTGGGATLGAYLRFDPERSGSAVHVRIASSFIGFEQARINLERELAGLDLEGVAARGRDVWNARLERLELAPESVEEGSSAAEGVSDAQRRTAYSALYRSLLFPRALHEIDAAGRRRHRSPYDGEVHAGTLVGDNGFWDTHRTVYPLLTLLYPDTLQEILEGWVQAVRESGWFPKWASPGHQPVMIGTHSDAVVADAVTRGLTGFDVETAYRGLRRNATEPAPPGGAVGRVGLAEYDALGWVPCDRVHASVSRTLDFALGDFCVAQVARRLGERADAARFYARARSYRNVFDAEVGFMRGRRADGAWEPDFSPIRWGGPFVEGAAWQYRFGAPHDAAGLAELHGGRGALCDRLDAMLDTPPDFEVGDYPYEIHEMTEMARAPFGQYAHSNQPVHHVLWLYTHAGRPWRTQREVRRVLDELYHDGPGGLPGDEDNGEMSAWYLLAALGLYPASPGHPSWVLTTPRFPRATLHPEAGEPLTVETVPAPGEAPGGPYTHAVTLDGRPLERLWLHHDELAGARRLRVTTGSSPNRRLAVDPARLPFSLSRMERAP